MGSNYGKVEYEVYKCKGLLKYRRYDRLTFSCSSASIFSNGTIT